MVAEVIAWKRIDDSHAVTECGRYLLLWSWSRIGIWYVACHIHANGRDVIYDGRSESDAKAHCYSHAMFSKPNTQGAMTC